MTPQTARCGMAKHSPVPGTTICQSPAASFPFLRLPLVACAPGTVAGVRAGCRDLPLLPLYAYTPPSGAPSPRGMDNFLAMYSGVYDNTAQCRRDPGAILSRKEHRRVELPQLGPHVRFVHPMLYRPLLTITKQIVIWPRWRCYRSRQITTHILIRVVQNQVFFVKEQTDRGQGWVFRIRLALIGLLRSTNTLIFHAKVLCIRITDRWACTTDTCGAASSSGIEVPSSLPSRLILFCFCHDSSFVSAHACAYVCWWVRDRSFVRVGMKW